jgi:GPH family glycoside/pentoside/hexuronide:cation symporter
VLIIFTLAMGFNFVALFNYYITIFYIYGGDAVAAGRLLGINGTVWAVTGLVAVFPLNWLSKRLGKNKTLLISILLMCAAQLSKIVCYNPQYPYLAVIPTILLSSGMLMFFTLGSSMVADVCDEDELHSGTRSEGSYYAVYWWFIKMGTAFASFVTGALLVFTTFDEQQNVSVDSLMGIVAASKAHAESPSEAAKLTEKLASMVVMAEKLRIHFEERATSFPEQAEHLNRLVQRADSIRAQAALLQSKGATAPSAEVARRLDVLQGQMTLLKRQSPQTLFRLRLVEIGLPLVLSIVSIVLTLRYPLTEERCYEIKAALKRRRAGLEAAPVC